MKVLLVLLSSVALASCYPIEVGLLAGLLNGGSGDGDVGTYEAVGADGDTQPGAGATSGIPGTGSGIGGGGSSGGAGHNNDNNSNGGSNNGPEDLTIHDGSQYTSKNTDKISNAKSNSGSGKIEKKADGSSLEQYNYNNAEANSRERTAEYTDTRVHDLSDKRDSDNC